MKLSFWEGIPWRSNFFFCNYFVFGNGHISTKMKQNVQQGGGKLFNLDAYWVNGWVWTTNLAARDQHYKTIFAVLELL